MPSKLNNFHYQITGTRTRGECQVFVLVQGLAVWSQRIKQRHDHIGGSGLLWQKMNVPHFDCTKGNAHTHCPPMSPERKRKFIRAGGTTRSGSELELPQETDAVSMCASRRAALFGAAAPLLQRCNERRGGSKADTQGQLQGEKTQKTCAFLPVRLGSVHNNTIIVKMPQQLQDGVCMRNDVRRLDHHQTPPQCLQHAGGPEDKQGSVRA